MFAVNMAQAADPLPSWNDTSAKKAIIAFVEKVTKKGSAEFVPPPERIAVFDNDGTLWPENPVPFQLAYALDALKKVVEDKPELKQDPMVKAALRGVLFTDHYAQPSCTAGRAAFITGQYPIRSGMTTVGQPGDALGLQAESPCLAEVLKAEGYATEHFGKNHLGDRNEHLPTVHGFDEFYGNLYHLNTQEEAEQRDYQNIAKKYSGSLEEYEKKFGTRGVIHSVATDVDDPIQKCLRQGSRQLPVADPGYGYVYWNPQTKEAWAVLSDGDDSSVHDKWKNALKAIPGVKSVRTEAEYGPHDDPFGSNSVRVQNRR